MNETSGTTDSQGTKPQNTDFAAAAKLSREMDRLTNKIRAVNSAYEEFVGLTTLLTTQVEN